MEYWAVSLEILEMEKLAGVRGLPWGWEWHRADLCDGLADLAVDAVSQNAEASQWADQACLAAGGLKRSAIVWRLLFQHDVE